jgi:uncharacterized protein YcbK (DUF882 family)
MSKENMKEQVTQLNLLKAQLKSEKMSLVVFQSTRSWILRDLHHSHQNQTQFLVDSELELATLESNRKLIRTVLKDRKEPISSR